MLAFACKPVERVGQDFEKAKEKAETGLNMF